MELGDAWLAGFLNHRTELSSWASWALESPNRAGLEAPNKDPEVLWVGP